MINRCASERVYWVILANLLRALLIFFLQSSRSEIAEFCLGLAKSYSATYDIKLKSYSFREGRRKFLKIYELRLRKALRCWKLLYCVKL